MDEFELAQLRQNPKWVAILDCYQQVAIQSREKSKEFDGWVPRIGEFPETSREELPGIHGKLIAHGFLKFDLAGRDGGIRYQLTPLGKQSISSAVPSEAEEAEADAA